MHKDFRTVFTPQQSSLELNHHSNIYLTGSCFAENIGKKLTNLKFSALVNPFGISYNPISIHKTLNLSHSLTIEPTNVEGIYFSYDLHSELNSNNEVGFKENIEAAILKQNTHLKSNSTLIISYGTAWVYERLENGKLVNNCHKQPSKLFSKRMLSVDEIVNSWHETKKQIEERFGKQQYIFTVSPVRHLKDGFRENQLSKSVLHLAVNEICKHHQNCHYFPAYELMLDDLRDYRFFKDDLLHPNDLAINYIWGNFSETYFNTTTLQINQQIERFNASLQHRAFQPDSKKHQQFLLNLKSKIKAFQLVHNLDFKTEIDFVKRQIG